MIGLPMSELSTNLAKTTCIPVAGSCRSICRQRPGRLSRASCPSRSLEITSAVPSYEGPYRLAARSLGPESLQGLRCTALDLFARLAGQGRFRKTVGLMDSPVGRRRHRKRGREVTEVLARSLRARDDHAHHRDAGCAQRLARRPEEGDASPAEWTIAHEAG